MLLEFARVYCMEYQIEKVPLFLNLINILKFRKKFKSLLMFDRMLISLSLIKNEIKMYFSLQCVKEQHALKFPILLNSTYSVQYEIIICRQNISNVCSNVHDYKGMIFTFDMFDKKLDPLKSNAMVKKYHHSKFYAMSTFLSHCYPMVDTKKGSHLYVFIFLIAL